MDRQKSLEKQDRLMSQNDEDDNTLWEWGAMPRKSVTEDMSPIRPGGPPPTPQGTDGLYYLACLSLC